MSRFSRTGHPPVGLRAESWEARAERRERGERAPAIGHACSVTTRTSARLHHRNTSAPVPSNDRRGAARSGELVRATILPL
jgi:hypothetical protein